jgi:pentatricopeptide repeat protein
LLDYFLKEGREDKAAMVLKEMETRGTCCLPNDVTYNVVISWLTRKGDLGEAVELVDWVRLSKKASSFTYNPLITGLFARGFLKKVEALQLVMENEGIMPSVVTYNSVIHGLLQSGQVEAAQLKFVEMRAMGLLPDVITYNSLLNGYCKAGNLKEALWLLGDLRRAGLAPTILTYNTDRWL